MESDRFDKLARAAGRERSRRDALRVAIGAGLGAGALAALIGDSDAKTKKKKKHPKNRCTGPTGVCGADPTACGVSATGETCGCELAKEGNRFCADGANPCPVVRECTSTKGKEATSCRNMLGFHFVCQEAKANGAGQFCGCGFGTATGRVCVAECDNPN
ncbi:MAG TPA: hypothetical protein VFQ80_09570 [Thermomicrobiales bacterium]|jgi:hypothetical protein|nr:hypothetical protein [Thermomicrobiales bacterium]